MERILIVDDDKINVKLTKFILDQAGYEVMTADSGESAIEILREIHFDMVLLDIMMPDMNGLEVLKIIRGIPEIARIKVIFLTASTSPADLKDAIRLDAAQYIQKPCLPEDLLHMVKEAFAHKDDALLLVVDDDPLIQKVARHVFNSMCHVQCVSSGSDAVEFVRKTVPDLILMDLNMPDMDGLAAFQHIRALPVGRRVPIMFMTMDENSETEEKLFKAGAVDFIRKPFVAEAVRERAKRILELERLQKYLHEEVDKRNAELLESNRKIRRLSEQIIQALANAIDAKDTYTNGHSSRVAAYAREIARRMGKAEKEIEDTYYAGMLHDVGKIGIPREIITKTSRLTPEEYAVIQEHTVILRSISELPRLSIGARWHHEHYDGRGYPDGLVGKDIPEIARIICVADCYDAMSSNRSYRGALAQKIVRGEIAKGRYTQFDPDIADIMLDMIDEDKDYRMREL